MKRVKDMLNAVNDEIELAMQKGKDLEQEIQQKQSDLQNLSVHYNNLQVKKQTLEELLEPQVLADVEPLVR